MLPYKFDLIRQNSQEYVWPWVYNIDYNRYIPFLPVKLYLKSYADVGYAYDRPENHTRLSNKLLYTGGVGLDVLTLYDIQASFEYSLNQLNEKGLFLRVRGFL